MTAKKNQELSGIQYLRGIAAVMVVMSHVTAMARFPKYFNLDIFGRFFETGATGVELFFVISGFIIAYTSLSTSFRPKLSPREFFGKRFTRIVPLMWICIISYALLRYLGRGAFDPIPYLRALVLFPVGQVTPNVIWTLRHEALFYIVFCASWVTGRYWLYVVAAWFVSPIIVTVFDQGLYDSALFSFVFNRLNLLFGAGFVIALLYIKGFIRPRIEFKHAYLLSIVGGIVLMIYANLSMYVSEQHLRTTLDVFMITLMVSAIVTIMLSFKQLDECSFGNRVLKLLGDASYSIYLFHEFFVSAVLGLWSSIDKGANPAFVLIGVTLAAIVGSTVVYVLIERPLISWLHVSNATRANYARVNT